MDLFGKKFQLIDFGEDILKQDDIYFFHDVHSYEELVREKIPDNNNDYIDFLLHRNERRGEK